MPTTTNGPEDEDEDVDVVETVHALDNVHVAAYDVAALRARFDDWDDLDDATKLARIEQADPPITPVHDSSSHNVTCIELHEYVANNLSPTSQENYNISHLVVGTADDPPPGEENRSLTEELGTTRITSADVVETTVTATTFIGSGEFNGFTLREVGLRAGPRLLNHALIQPFPKDSTRTATIACEITHAGDGSV